jgi:RNA polymerase sigma factor (sigma-70 family)
MSASETASAATSASAWMPGPLLSDARLARLAGRGDQRAFEAIFRRYHQELYRYCRAILGDPDEAQDALQSTMASALRALPGEERPIALRPWLYRVAHNEAVTILRQRAGIVDPDSVPDQTAAGADFEAESRERLRDLVADLDQLPERQRGALVMRELSGLTYAEIAAALDTSAAAARQVTYEARLALRDLDRGREMECEAARRALSERDGRVRRNRRLRAHLRACEGCSGFEAAISRRRSDLQALCPPLPAAAASSLLATVLAGGGGGGGVGAAAGAATAGTVGTAGATALTGPIAVKGASIVAAVVIGAGAAGVSGVVKLPLVGPREGPAGSSSAPSAVPGAAHHDGASAVPGAAHPAPAADTTDAGRHGTSTSTNVNGQGRGNASDRGGAAQGGPNADAPGRAGGDTAASGGLPATSNGKPPDHSSAGGNGNGGGAALGGKPSSPPGLANAAANAPTLPPQAQGKPASPAGHDSSAPGKGASAPAHSGLQQSHGASSAANRVSKGNSQ